MLKIESLVTVTIVTIASLVLLLAFHQQDTHTNTDATTSSYIVQAGSLDQALGAVTEAGGEITHELDIINAVGANLTPSQVEILRQMEGVNVLQNRRLSVTAGPATVRDEFAEQLNSGDDGTQTWSGPWVESDEGEVEQE